MIKVISVLQVILALNAIDYTLKRRWSPKTGQCDKLNPILQPIWLSMIHGMIHKTKGKFFFVLISVPPENKNSRAMIHMVTVKAHGACLVQHGEGYPKQGRRLL